MYRFAISLVKMSVRSMVRYTASYLFAVKYAEAASNDERGVDKAGKTRHLIENQIACMAVLKYEHVPKRGFSYSSGLGAQPAPHVVMSALRSGSSSKRATQDNINVFRPEGNMPTKDLPKNHPSRISLVSENPRSCAALPFMLLEATRVTKIYGKEASDSVRALDEITVTLADGEFVSVVGPSGCGKSTLMKLIAGLYPPSGGTIRYRDQEVKKPQRGMGIVFQTPVLLPWLTILENVLLPIRVLKMNKAVATERALNLLDMVGLSGFQSKHPSELSGGMQQRAAIVRSLIHDPSLLLMDEPFGALDALTRERMTIELQRIWLMNKKTIFFITHSILESVFLSDRVIVMSARPGRIIKEFTIPFGRPRDFNLTTKAEFGAYVAEIRQLLGATNDG